MIRIAIGGLRKELIQKAANEAGQGQVETIISSDFEAVKMVKAGKADYYLGACNSGGGAALSVAIGILGYANCSTVAKAGGRPKQSEIEKRVQEGKVAFGMSVETIEEAVPMIVESILKAK
ncbi:DUF2620 domain-containing protein [Melghirimyces algeriensis]|uniref:DUF2620 domain-containing protein n=1 Tax=Melghirimyces algeriensis TaxID=910412 RepID=A0A521DAQ6_9BACL|nr:DUF2620 domain-containing protein [Melghirimyces algeriensis]SMO68725.1 Protein of unknown function DUF2620 [Melghirimyces algeriensis]